MSNASVLPLVVHNIKTQEANPEDSDMEPPPPLTEDGEEDSGCEGGEGDGDDDDVSNYIMDEDSDSDDSTDLETQPIRRRAVTAGGGRGSGSGGAAGDTFTYDPKDYNYNGYFADSPTPSPEASAASAGARGGAFKSPQIPPRRSFSKAARAGSAAAAVAANSRRRSQGDTPRPARQFRSLRDPAPIASTPRMMAGALRNFVSITSTMQSDEVFNQLRQVASPTVLSGLAGHLLPFVAPSFAKSMVSCPEPFAISRVGTTVGFWCGSRGDSDASSRRLL